MVENYIKLFLLICFLFSFIISETIPTEITFNENTGFNEKFYGSQTFKINFNKGYEFIHLKVTSEEGKNPIVLMSSEDQECKDKRKLMTMQPYNAINVFFKKNFIPYSSEYLCIRYPQTDVEDPKFTLEIKNEDICQLSLGEQYSYYVDEKSTKMQFQFIYDSSLFLRNLATVFNTNFWVKGQSHPKVEPIESFESKEFDYGTLFSGEYVGGNNYIIRIDAQEGDYITVGSLIIDDGVSKELKVNDLEIMGLLKKDENEICFPIKTDSNLNGKLIRINGNAYTKNLITYFKHDGIKNETSSKNVENGLIEDLFYNNNKENSYCLKHLDEGLDAIYSLQITSNSFNNLNQFIYPPHLPGVIYSHHLLKGEVAVFQAMKPKEGAKEINFNMKAIKGFPDMLFDICLTFPDCTYIPNHYQFLANPHHSNRMTVYSYYLNEQNTNFKEFNPITSFQPVLIVECVNGTTEEESVSEFCEFETSIFTNKDRLSIIEGETFSQYLLKEEEDLYTINIENQQNLQKIYLDLIVFSGDVDFIFESTDVEAHKYFISNKIFYSIQINNNPLKKIDFKVKAYKNSFYLVQHQLVKDNLEESKDVNLIESGVNYIQSILVGDKASLKKHIFFKNLKFDTRTPFLVSFYSQNCRYLVTREIDSIIGAIPIYDNYGQLIIDENDPFYNTDKYSFTIDIISDDNTNYNNKLCLFYLTGLELTNSDTGTERSISVSDGIPQYYIFTKKYPFMKYSYHISDLNNPVIINFNLLDKAPYIVKVYFGYLEKVRKTIYRNENIILISSTLKEECKDKDEVCTINLSIELENKDNENESKLETTIFQVRGAPIYLEKNVVKQDLLLGNELRFFYLDLGKGDTGDITVDYKRGNGYIYAKVVNKMNTEFDPKADWRGIYEFPINKNDSLRYETYLKKIIINPDDTKNCDEGCYLLITLVNAYYKKYTESEENIAYLPYRVTITPRIANIEKLYESELVPIIKMKINEFVVGNLYPTDKKIYEYYQVTLPFDSDYVFIDWQADKSSLLVNVGEYNKPTKDNHHFQFNSNGYDNTFKIYKSDIIKNLDKYSTNLNNVVLTLGIWNFEVDTLYTSVYAFKISMPLISYKGPDMSKPLEITHIRSNQKVQCDPFEYSSNTYACIFAVIFDESDTNSSLIVYPKAENENWKINFTGELLDAEPIERNNLTYIQSKLSSLNEFNSELNKFMYVHKIDRSKALFFMATTITYTKMEVFSSTYQLFDQLTIIPNPSTAQIFALGKNKIIKFNFETTKDLLINIVSLSGEGSFNWNTNEEEKIQYYLNGFEDRLTLTSATSIEKNQNSLLVVQSNTFVADDNDKDAGFVFYMTFYPRNDEYNIDQIKIGRSTEFNYREPKFPLNFYTRLTNKEVAISLTFYNFYMDKGEKINYDNNLYQIWGKILKEEDAMNARFDEYYRPNNDMYAVRGSVDGPFATLYFSAQDIEKFNIKEEENPTIFFSVDMAKEQKHNFKEIGVEVSLLREQNENEIELFAIENVYYHGKLSNNKTSSSPSFKYKLRAGEENNYMRIEFSANSDYVKYAVTNDKNEKTTFKGLIGLEEKYLNGRKLITFQIPKLNESYLYLIVYIDIDKDIDSKLTNYIFKYMNSNDKINFPNFQMESEELEVQTSGNYGSKTYTISFYPIEHHDVSYYIKGIYHKDIIDGEKKDTIAISESNGYNLLIENPDFDGESKVSLDLENIKEKIDYIKVLAKVNFDTNKQFLLYKPYTISGEEGNDTGEYELISPSEQLIPLKYDIGKQLYKGNARDAYKIQKYQINFEGDKDKLSDYINIQLSSDESLKNKVISISTSDENGKENRIQMTQLGIEKSVNLWIKKEQIQNNYLYAIVECDIKGDEKCNYLMDFSGSDYASMKSSVLNYNYYVNKENKEMKFRISNDLSLKSTENSNKVLTIIATGGKNIKLNLKDQSGKEYSNNNNIRSGSAIIAQISDNSNFDLTVEAEEGDYITLGSKIIMDEKSDANELEPNGHEISGYLERNKQEKECYLIPDKNSESQYSYIVAIFNKPAEISFKDKDFNIIGENETITKGYYTYVYDYNNSQNKRKYLCVGLPNANNFSSNSLSFSLKLTQPTNQKGSEIKYNPQLKGIIYPRIIPKGTYAIFIGSNVKSINEQIIYNMKTTKGIPKMYVCNCTNYPLCEIDINNRTDLIKVNEINHISTWQNIETENNTPISPIQNVMVVICEDISDSITDICQFQTSIYGNQDSVSLLEKQSFSQYIFAKNKSQYTIDLFEEESISKIHIDAFIVTGDVDLSLSGEENKEISSHKYYLSNKIFYSISLKDNSQLKKIFVNVEAKVNTYYIIEYKLVKDIGSEFTNDIYSGISYLIPFSRKEKESKKIVNIHNFKTLTNNFYFNSFYSLNCQFKIERIDDNGQKLINSFANFAQNTLSEDEVKDKDTISYNINIEDVDPSEYDNNMCMLYVSSLEIEPEKYSKYQNEILISEGVPQRIVFESLLQIKYIYPVPDKDKNVAIYFKVLNPGDYVITIAFNNESTEKMQFYASHIKYIPTSQINQNCGNYDLCTISLSIESFTVSKDYTPKLEISIRQMDNIPYYISKGVVKKDFVPGDSWLNLFTTLGKNDNGYINVNFARGSGLIYAKIVPINGEGDKDPDWRQYKFPRTQEGTLKYDFYNKKILITNEDTSKCDDGCYLLISIESSVKGKLDEQYRFHIFSITVELIPNGKLKTDGPIIQIEPEEYITGSFNDSKRIKNKDMYEFYQINIPYDADRVEFDLQADSIKLLVNIGEERPTIDNSDFQFESYSDGTFEISRDKIKEKLETENTIANAFITIGVYTEDMETNYGTAYSFRVHFSKNLNIYTVNSDQKTLCNPDLIDNNLYRCLFIIIYDELEFLYDLMIYSKSQSSSGVTYMYGDFLYKEIYDQLDMNALEAKIPNETAKFNTKRDQTDYIFLTDSNIFSHFYVSVISDKPDIIEFITSFKTFDEELSPNPSTVQLFAINNSPSMKLKFKTTKPLFINLVSLCGTSKIYLEDEPDSSYIIRGRDDRLSLALPYNSGKEAILIVENMNKNKEKTINFFRENNITIEKPEIAFYLDFYLRSNDLNLDEIYLGKTSEIAYKSSDLPISYYTKLNYLQNYLNIFFNFHDFDISNKIEDLKIDSKEFSFKATIISQQDIYKLKTGEILPSNIEEKIEGVYDPAIQVGQLLFTSEKLKEFVNIPNPNLYISLEKGKNNIEFKSIRLELTAFQNSSEIPVTEKIYQYGKLLNQNDINSYKLNVDNSTGYMRIQFAANSEKIDFAINEKNGDKTNSSLNEMETKIERGKVFVTFKKPDKEFIYLNVFPKENNFNEKLTNYVFKYMNSDDKNYFFEYPILNNDASLQESQDKKNLKVEFNKIDKNDVKITYSLKLISNSDFIKDEKIKTVALTNSKSFVSQLKEPNGNQISMKINNIDNNKYYIQVIAQIKDGPIIEYVAYEPKEINFNYDNKDDVEDDDDNKTLYWVLIAVGGAIFIVLVVLITIFIFYNRRTKELLEQVNKISFAKPRQEQDSLLLQDDKNELK